MRRASRNLARSVRLPAIDLDAKIRLWTAITMKTAWKPRDRRPIRDRKITYAESPAEQAGVYIKPTYFRKRPDRREFLRND